MPAAAVSPRYEPDNNAWKVNFNSGLVRGECDLAAREVEPRLAACGRCPRGE